VRSRGAPTTTTWIPRAARTLLSFKSWNHSVFLIMTLHGIEQFIGVVADAVLEHELNIFDVPDPRGWIAFDDDKVCVLAD